MSLSIRFWGVRGSIPSPGPATAGVGGNTSCVEIRCGDQQIILDAGTGLRALGDALMRAGEPVTAHVLFSHVHWDHIQGLPFFAPIYRPATTLHLHGAPEEGSLAAVLRTQMTAPHFPVGFDQAPARLVFHEPPRRGRFAIGPIAIATATLNHPNGVMAYRIECEGRSVVYATDTEHLADGGIDSRLVELARDADVLIYDAQYTPDEYCGAVGVSRMGWGHSTWEEGVRVARAADVKRLVLFHHEPSHDDATVEAIEAKAAAARPGTVAAREGLVIQLESHAARAAA
jgi:phosphoribosyl 1,2-cyclic phosphodiesterase